MLLCGTGVRLRTELIAVFLKRLYELLDIFQTDETAQYRCQILLSGSAAVVTARLDGAGAV